ncbi:hypothetical protein [Spirosoma gilvum]
MNQEETTKFFGYEASAEEIQKLVMEWASATDAFHRRYAKLNQVINSLQASFSRQSSVSRTRLRNLIDLREQMSDVLMTLFLDMSPNSKSGRSALPSKPGQLHSHAILLRELNRKIDAELIGVIGSTTVAQA